MIRVRQCEKAYDGKSVLHDIDLDIGAGEFLAIIGPNGSGKTTLLRLLSGEEEPDLGIVELMDQPATRWKSRKRAKWVTVVAQEGISPVSFSVYDVVMMGRYIYQTQFHAPSTQDHEVVEQVLAATGLQPLAQKPVSQLSGGERQRVAIARAMAQEPHVLLLDEPTTYLDLKYQLQILEYVHAWQVRTGATVVSVLHDLNLAAQFFRRIVVLQEGRVVADGSPFEVFNEDLLQRVYQTRPTVIRHPRLDVPQVLLESETVLT